MLSCEGETGERRMGYDTSKVMRRCAWILVLDFLGFLGCGNEASSTVSSQDASLAVVADATAADVGTSDADKVAACNFDTQGDIGRCICRYCAIEAYDCMSGQDPAASLCRDIEACALATGCSDMASCTSPDVCGSYLSKPNAVAAIGMLLNLQACLSKNCGEYTPSQHGGSDAGKDATAAMSPDATNAADVREAVDVGLGDANTDAGAD